MIKNLNKMKKRNWVFILYPESAPENWKDFLIQTGVPCCISPLHDKDINPTGESKKPHYHIMLSFDGPTTFNNIVTCYTEPLNQPIPQFVESINGYYRYFTHKDNPEKAQYNEKDIICLNGFDILEYKEITKSEALMYLEMIQDYITENGISEFCDLLDLLHSDEDLKNLYYIATQKAFLIDKYISSKRNKLKEIKEKNLKTYK